MNFEELKLDQIRTATRHFIPETNGEHGIAKRGSKEELIALLQAKGVMACEAYDYCESVKNSPDKESDTEGQDGVCSVEAEVVSVEDGGQYTEPELPSIDSIPVSVECEEDSNSHCDDELELIRKIITKNVKQSEVNKEEIDSIIDQKFVELRKKIRKEMVKVIEVKQVDLPNKVIGTCHRLTEQIANVANLGIHQMLVGPAGSGKTTCGEKVAEILNLQFYPMSVGPQTTKSDLLGFIDAAGNYHDTPLRRAFEFGGLLLLDEVDAANAGVLTIINSLLANGYCSFPDAVIKRHESFRCICSANTFGRGADRQYVGRNQLDAATLDRFAVVDFDYDEAMERQIAGNDDWVDRVQKYRKRAFDLKMRIVISPRASIFGAKLLASGMKIKDVEELVIWKGVSEEIRSKIMA